jgi:tetratricopeptide (TPR) repeat protein
MFRKATDANPSYARAFTSWAELERKAGRLDKAKRLSEKAIAADPKFATAYNLRGEILLEQMHLKDAIGMFDRARAANRTWSTPLYNRGRALRLSGDFDGAIAAFKEVTKQDHHARAYAQLGLALAQKAAKEHAADERSQQPSTKPWGGRCAMGQRTNRCLRMSTKPGRCSDTPTRSWSLRRYPRIDARSCVLRELRSAPGG